MRRFTCTGIMRGVLPSRPAMAVVRSWSMVPTDSPALLIFHDWYRLGKTEYTYAFFIGNCVGPRL